MQILSNPSMSFLLGDKIGMIAPKQFRQKRRVVIEFLLTKGETAQNISRRLKHVYGDGAIDYSTVTSCVKQINDGQEESAQSNLCDRPRSSRLSSAHSSANIDQANDIHSMIGNSFFSACFFIKRTPTRASTLVRLNACSFGQLSRQKIH